MQALQARAQTVAEILMLMGMVIATLIAAPALAVPSFADQTGQPCQSCHVGGLGPQLTSFGRTFKLNGYTLRAKSFNLPLAAMIIASGTRTRRDQVPPPDTLRRNDNVVVDQSSIFLAGGVGKHLGGFAQMTYDGVSKNWAWDNLDLRAVTRGTLLGTDAVFGLTLNNAPTVQDAWNTTPSWSFPYTDTAVSPTPGAAPLIDGRLAQSVLGLTAYAWIGERFYFEAGGYSSPSAGTLRALGTDPADPGNIHGIAPYGRMAYQRDIGDGTLEVGAFTLKAAIDPERMPADPFRDRYTDIGLDASWLRPTRRGDTITAHLRYIHEVSDLRASCALGLLGHEEAPDCAHTHLNQWRANASYYFRGRVGATLGAFGTTGSSNAAVFGPRGRPDSDGVIGQLDYTPWGAGNSPLGPLVNLRIGIQYTAYGKFDGARHNYDGAGTNAADNNAIRIFTWIAF